MAEEKQPAEDAPTFQVRAQYVKDLSFESPGAPASLIANEERPNIDVGIDLQAQKLQEDIFEVTVKLTTRATMDKKTVFLVELSYAGIFKLSGIPEENMEGVLLVDCPFILFPFARRVVADVTRDGGFPPLMLDPIDFHQLHLQNKAKSES